MIADATTAAAVVVASATAATDQEECSAHHKLCLNLSSINSQLSRINVSNPSSDRLNLDSRRNHVKLGRMGRMPGAQKVNTRKINNRVVSLLIACYN